MTSDPRPLAEGDPRRISGYLLTGVLGAGGQGVVYLGRTPQGRPVAVKTLHARLAGDAEARERFLREAAIAARVAAFCTARVLDAGVEDGRPYLVSEYVAGPSLEGLVARDGPRAGGGLDRLAITTLTALQAIHRAGVVHRDLKPSNVIMGPEGPVVIDFGIARVLEQSTTGSGLVGTPAYLSPELLNGDPAGTASDVFAWAATMVYAATGHRAFPGAVTAVVLNAIMTRDPDLTGVPGHLRALLAACLAKDPASRPAVAGLLTALTQERSLPGPRAALPRRRLVRALAAGAVVAAVPAAYGLVSLFSPGATVPFGSLVREPVAGRQKWILSVALSLLNNRPVVVSGGYDGTLAVADLATGAPVGAALLGHRGPVWSVATGRLPGGPFAVSGGSDGTVRVWDLTTGTPLLRPLTGHRASVESVAVGRLGARPVAASGSSDGTVRVWDLTNGAPVGAPAEDHASWVLAVAVGRLGDRPVVASGGHDGAVLVSDLATGARMAGRARAHRGPVESMTVGQVGDRPVAISGGGDGDHTVRVWDLATAAPVGAPLAGHRSWALGLAAGELPGGRAVAVSGGYRDETVRVWDLAAGKQLGGPFLGHRGLIESVAVGLLDDRPVAVSGGDDGKVRVWSLEAPYPPATG
ncbi:WD40 repeat protein/predicted Ser/Thr protein kinase [Nonomuraea thailandensis]|uniref:WD40 repeat protein/predicted Ser/Thr protein kinase n=1 Tax=Nonomuraea thailandensis TaxID=1188745 RepID=A0A9X2GGV8_9ACTN|nr:serine/threonine-protein kinase [Nonomuraea thailandensis]MCP2357432.1 WD40 repeat protein/predicted Ser/Thr protein kinase [Nonomuraea thailandensis]